MMEQFIKNPRYVGFNLIKGIKFPDLGKPETLERRYLGRISKKALSFMKALLKLDPQERLSAKESLNHPYFDGIREQD